MTANDSLPGIGTETAAGLNMTTTGIGTMIEIAIAGATTMTVIATTTIMIAADD